MMNARAGDGSDDKTGYTSEKTRPGAWRPTSYPDMADAKCQVDGDAVNPVWGQVKRSR